MDLRWISGCWPAVQGVCGFMVVTHKEGQVGHDAESLKEATMFMVDGGVMVISSKRGMDRGAAWQGYSCRAGWCRAAICISFFYFYFYFFISILVQYLAYMYLRICSMYLIYVCRYITIYT